MDCRSQAFGGRGSRLTAIGSIRGLSCVSLWSLTWIVIHRPLVATFGVYKPLMADEVV